MSEELHEIAQGIMKRASIVQDRSEAMRRIDEMYPDEIIIGRDDGSEMISWGTNPTHYQSKTSLHAEITEKRLRENPFCRCQKPATRLVGWDKWELQGVCDTCEYVSREE